MSLCGNSRRIGIWNKKAGVNKSEEVTNRSAFIKVQEKTGGDFLNLIYFLIEG